MSLFEQISKDIMASMKARDKVRTTTLRNIKKYFIEAKTAPGASDELTDEQAMKIIIKLAKQSRDSSKQYLEAGREDLAQEEEAQAAIIEEYLPKQLTPQELENEVKAIIEATGASSMKDMGRVMGMANKQLAGKADGGAIAAIVKKMLA